MNTFYLEEKNMKIYDYDDTMKWLNDNNLGFKHLTPREFDELSDEEVESLHDSMATGLVAWCRYYLTTDDYAKTVKILDDICDYLNVKHMTIKNYYLQKFIDEELASFIKKCKKLNHPDSKIPM
jgi:AICAR transformylase/IMP cyclohydrolase PurH